MHFFQEPLCVCVGGVPSAGVQGPLHGAPRELAAGQTPGLGDKVMATLLCHTQTAAPGAGRQQAGEAGARGVFARAFCFTHTTPL